MGVDDAYEDSHEDDAGDFERNAEEVAKDEDEDR